MTTIIKMMVSIMSMMLKIAWRIIKFLCGPMWDSVKSLCKSSWELYKQKKVQKAANASGSAESASCPVESTGPDERVQFSAKDLKSKYIHCKNEDLERMRELMTDNAVKVDKQPELEKVLETYGPDQEILKQEIDCELKRRSMESKKQNEQNQKD